MLQKFRFNIPQIFPLRSPRFLKFMNISTTHPLSKITSIPVFHLFPIFVQIPNPTDSMILTPQYLRLPSYFSIPTLLVLKLKQSFAWITTSQFVSHLQSLPLPFFSYTHLISTEIKVIFVRYQIVNSFL